MSHATLAGKIRPFAFFNALLLTTAFTAPAFAAIETVVVTAEKRSQDIQTVPIAISAFTSEKRDAVGIKSVQDMTNFTPGLAYQTSLDRVFLRGVGRQTNSQGADTPVANYDDGLYETFAVAAGRSSLDLDRVEILRGPQGTLSGRNALAGAINEITRRPSTDDWHSEARLTYGAYNHITPELRLSGPLDDTWAFAIYGLWDYQTQGYSKNIYPNAQQGTNDPLYTGLKFINPVVKFGNKDDGNVINEWYGDAQIQAKFSPQFEMWTKFQSAQWWNGAGGPGADLEGWTPADYATYEVGQQWPADAFHMNPGYGCTAYAGSPYATANTTITPGTVVSNLPGALACTNPGAKNPWHQSRLIQTQVRLPNYFSVNSQWTWHTGDFDVKYIVGGSYYRYHLSTQSQVSLAPIQSYTIGNYTIDNRYTFNPEEENSFVSNEINLISTNDSPLQWVLGFYQFQQQANQPGDIYNPYQPQINSPFGGNFVGGFSPAFWCSGPAIFGGNGVGTGGVCAPSSSFRQDDSRNNIHDHSYAIFGHADYKVLDELTLNLGLRQSWDVKSGYETARVTCWFGFCDAFGNSAEFATFVTPLLGKSVDFTQTGLIASSGVPVVPKGVVGPTTYNPATGFAFRKLHSGFNGMTGEVGLQWQPDTDTNAYVKFARGYKDGGYYEGANTVLNAQPFTKSEHVDSYQAGIKRQFGDWLTANIEVFHYRYQNLQIPLQIVTVQGVVTLAQSQFFNVPASVSDGVELETTIQPIEDLAILFNYSYNDAHVAKGIAFDPADPDAIAAGAAPVATDAQCLASFIAHTGLCYIDTYMTGTAPGGQAWAKPQNLRGNALPNAARNKIALNAAYTFHTDWGPIIPSASFVWRDKQFGGPGSGPIQRSYNEAPSWYQVDLQLRWASEDDNYEVIFQGKNITNQIAYDTGAVGTRLGGSNNGIGGTCLGVAPALVTAVGGCNFVQGVNGPLGYGAVRGEDAQGHIKTYQVAPPALWWIEAHYKFD